MKVSHQGIVAIAAFCIGCGGSNTAVDGDSDKGGYSLNSFIRVEPIVVSLCVDDGKYEVKKEGEKRLYFRLFVSNDSKAQLVRISELSGATIKLTDEHGNSYGFRQGSTRFGKDTLRPDEATTSYFSFEEPVDLARKFTLTLDLSSFEIEQVETISFSREKYDEDLQQID